MDTLPLVKSSNRYSLLELEESPIEQEQTSLFGGARVLPYRYTEPCATPGCSEMAKWCHKERLVCSIHFGANAGSRLRKRKVGEGAVKLKIGPEQLEEERVMLAGLWLSAQNASLNPRWHNRGSIIMRPCNKTRYPLVDGFVTIRLGKSGRMRGRVIMDFSNVVPAGLGLTREMKQEGTFYNIDSSVVKTNGEEWFLLRDGIEESITTLEYYKLYYSHYEKLVRASQEGKKLRSLLYPGRMSLIIVRNRTTPTLDEEGANAFLRETWGRDDFRPECALFFILLYWYQPERLPWN